jgi:tRNA(Ile)-lysidine synthase
VSGPTPQVAAVRVAVRRHVVDLPAGSTVLVACSGGADSLALAAATVFEGRTAALRVGAVTVDHGLQGGSAERASALARLLAERGLDPVVVQRVDVGTAGGPEAAARLVRYEALDEAADEHSAVAIMLGHTRDDQAETVLLGLARGSGARSLSGMAPVTGRYHRPLLGLDRTTTRCAARAEGFQPWDDPHNRDPAYARVRVRLEALPGLEAALGPGVAAALARTADLLRDDADALDGLADQALASAVDPGGAGLDTGVLVALPRALRTRVLRRAALAAGAPAGSLAAVHVEALDALVTGWHGQGTVDLPGGVGAGRACDRLSFRSRVPPGSV